MSGVELSRTVRDLHPQMPILLVTGHSEEILGSEGEFNLVSKPYGAKVLLEAMAQALNLTG